MDSRNTSNIRRLLYYFTYVLTNLILRLNVKLYLEGRRTNDHPQHHFCGLEPSSATW